MADEDPIVQTLTLEGGETAISDFQKFGEAGVKAFDDMYDAAERANRQVDEASAAGKKFGNSLTDAAQAAAGFVTSIGKLGGGIGALVTGYVAATKAIIAHNAASNTTQQTTRQLTQEVRASEQSLIDQKTAAVTNARAFSDLNDEFVKGKMTSEDYLKKSTELQTQQRHAAEDQRALQRIQQQATEDRLKEVAAMQKQAEAQQEYNDLVAKFGAPLTNALENIGRALNDVFTDFKQTFGPAAAELVNNIADAIRNNAGTIHDLFKTMADGLKPFTDDGGKRVQQMVSGIISALRVAVEFIKSVVIPAFEGIIAVLDVVAKVLNSMFGTEFTGAGIAAVIVIGQVTGAFKLLYTAGKALIDLGALLGKTPWGAAFTALIIVIGLVIEHFGGVEEVWKKLSAAWDSTTAYIKQVGNEWLEWFENTWIGRAISGINKLIEKFKELGKAQDDTTSGQKLQVDPESLAGATPVPPTGGGQEGGSFAGGGLVRGPGSSTSDSIRAWLSNNEWVVRARAVAYYGNNVMDAVNNMRIDPALLRSLVGGGSLVPQPGRTHFATGGQVSAASSPGGARFNLFINGEMLGDVTAPEHTAAKLVRYAVAKDARSAGKRQQWVGARS